MEYDEGSVEQVIDSEDVNTRKFSNIISIAPVEATINEPFKGGKRLEELKQFPKDLE
jgi:hypothetical protein